MPLKDPKRRRRYNRLYMRRYYKTEKGRARAQKNFEAQRERTKAVLAELKNVPCKDCGHSYPPCVMDFDHLDPKTKIRGVSHMVSEAAIRKEAAKCEVVCANCHRIRTHLREQP